MFSSLSQRVQNKNGRNTNLNTIIGERYVEAPPNNNNNNSSRDSTIIHDNNSKIDDNDINRVLVDSESTNFTISSDDEFAEIETNATNQSEEFPNENNTHFASNNIPDKKPTGIPISGGTSAESNEGEVIIDIAVTSTINLELFDTSSLMNQEQLELFLEITVGFLSFHLSRGNYMPSLFEREGIEVVLIQQSRSLIGRLYVSFQVTGMVNEEDSVASNSIVAEGNLNFDQVLEKIFVEKEGEYLEALKFVDGNYFSSLNDINIVVGQETNNSSEEKDLDSVYLPSEDAPNSPLPDISPPTESLNIGSIQETNGTSGNSEIQGRVLSLSAIIGITISAVGVLVMIASLIYYICMKDYKPKVGGNANDSRGKSSSLHKKKPWNRRSGLTGPADLVAEETLLRGQQPPSDTKSDLASNDDLESQAMYSYNRSHGSSVSVYTNGSNIKVYSNQSHNYGSDSLSYAYSLEPGIEASVVGSVITNDRDGFSNQENGSDIPIREIPQVRMTTTEKMGGVDRSKMTSQSEKDEHITYDHFGNTQIETAPSDLKLTESELEMLPSNLRSSDDESSNKLLTRKILAPAGKLGVVIDTTIEGPVVHGVNQGSQLSGKIFPGDIIIAIDEVDTRAMSASEITAVMIKTANQFRTLTVRGVS
jgi:hypothetical protein